MSYSLEIPLQQLPSSKLCQTNRIDWYAKQFETSLKRGTRLSPQAQAIITHLLNQARKRLQLFTKLQSMLNNFTMFYSLLILIVVAVVAVSQSDDLPDNNKETVMILILVVGIPLNLALLYCSIRELNRHIQAIETALQELNDQQHGYMFKPAKIVPWKSYLNFKIIEVHKKYI